MYNKKENLSLIESEEPNKIRLKVFNSDVKIHTGRIPKEYSKLMNRYAYEDHKRFLKIGNRIIGFMVSPFKLNAERHKALAIEGHKVIEMRQHYNENCETLAVIKNEYTSCILWKVFNIEK